MGRRGNARARQLKGDPLAGVTEELTIAQAADALKVSERFVREAVKDGSLPARLPFGKKDLSRLGRGHGYRIRRDDLAAWYFSE